MESPRRSCSSNSRDAALVALRAGQKVACPEQGWSGRSALAVGAGTPRAPAGELLFLKEQDMPLGRVEAALDAL
ncbi:MAG TPA: hypothetical protein VJU61_08705, partial [Polyangiaceae bacterium]|nr:hypothetical protein [Polyangiaceae bacterium]